MKGFLNILKRFFEVELFVIMLVHLIIPQDFSLCVNFCQGGGVPKIQDLRLFFLKMKAHLPLLPNWDRGQSYQVMHMTNPF
jgi:hypothetical protein